MTEKVFSPTLKGGLFLSSSQFLIPLGFGKMKTGGLFGNLSTSNKEAPKVIGKHALRTSYFVFRISYFV
ncbi:MAG: hypothetical protein ACR2MT_16480, partial [Aurantibacter sp.]